MNHIDLLSSVARLGALSLLGALLTPSAFAVCSGVSPNIVCTSDNGAPIFLRSTGTASITTPESAIPFPVGNYVSGLGGTIASVQVRLNRLSRERLESLDMLLVSPTGQQFVFFSDVGFPVGSSTVSNITVTLSDAATADLPQGQLASGTYRPKNFEGGVAATDRFLAPISTTSTAANSASPVGNATFASRFNGSDPNGTWNLYISMDGGPGSGSLASWDLIFNLNPPGTTLTTVTSSANPSLIPLTGNSTYTLTAAVTAAGKPVTIGTVSFSNGAQSLGANIPLDVNGRATLTVNTSSTLSPFLAEGSHIVTANYSGAVGFTASAGKLIQVVDRATLLGTGLNRYCNTGPIALPATANTPATPYPSKIFVTGLTGSTQSVQLALNGFTSPVSQLSSLLLVSPTGQKFIPLAFPGDASSTANNAILTLTDAATARVPASGTISTGIFLPTYNLYNNTVAPVAFVTPAPAGPYSIPGPAGAATFASTFGGAVPNGTWSLYAISWSGSGINGARAINSGWCLSFGLSTDPVTTTNVSVAPSPSALNQPATISAAVTSSVGTVRTQGAVTFNEGNTTLAGPILVDQLGAASFQTSSLSQGAHFLDAVYSGSPGLFGASSGQALHYVDGPTTNPAAGRFCNVSPITFPNVRNASGSPYPTRINASGLAGTVAKVTVDLLGFSHQNPDDLDLMVSGPNGNSLIAFSDVGGTSPVSNLNINLDSTVASRLPDNTPLTSGTFRPNDVEINVDTFAAPAPVRGPNVLSGSVSTFADAFNNSDPNGLWTLWSSVDNTNNKGGGSLAGGWCVNLTMNPPVLTLSKTHTGNFAQGQKGAQYSITVGSNGPGSTAGTITVVDTPPAGLTVTAMSGSGWSCTVSTLTCATTAPLAAGATLPPITVTVDVAASASTPLVNRATVSSSGATGASATDSTIITPPPFDLFITKTTSSSFVQGGTATYAITVTNAGPGVSPPFTVDDPMPPGLTALGLPSSPDTGWVCTATTSAKISCRYLGSLSSGSSVSIVFKVGIAADAPLSITNTATISAAGDSKTDNNTASSTVTVNSAPDITVTKVAQGTSFQQGGTITYLITVTNSGGSPTTTPITMSDVIPVGLTVTAVAGDATWACTNAPTVTCTRNAPLAPNASSVITLQANIGTGAPASIPNTAVVSGGGESNTGNNSGSSTVTVTPPPFDLFITKTTSSSFVQGGTATYAITVTNAGPGAAPPFTVDDPMPPGLTALGLPSSPDTGWVCTATTSAKISCRYLGTLSSGSSVSIVFRVGIAADAPLSITNTATISAAGDSKTDNNTASSTVTVNALVPVTINVPAGYTFVAQGQIYTGTQTLNVPSGTVLSLTTVTQQISQGVQAVLANWSDGVNTSTAPGFSTKVGTTPLTITATFTTQYQLIVSTNPALAGTFNKTTGFYDAGSTISLTVTPNTGFVFTSWTGPVTSPTTASTTVTLDAPKAVTANFDTLTPVTINVPAGYTFVTQGQIYTGPQTLNVPSGTVLSLTTVTQQISQGVQAVLANWSDGVNTSAAPGFSTKVGTTPLTITATFTTQYQLTVATNPALAGTFNKTTGFYDAGSTITLTVTPNTGFAFTSWTGPVTSPTTTSTAVTLDAPKAVTANFDTLTPVTINVPAGYTYTFRGNPGIGTQTFFVAPGTYVLDGSSPQTPVNGVRAVFSSWSDGGAASHPVTVGSSPISITGTFTNQYQLTTSVTPVNGGNINPASGGFYNAGTVVNLSANPSNGFAFSAWGGAVTSTNGATATVTMDAPKTVTAEFTPLTMVTVNVPAGIRFNINGTDLTGGQTVGFMPGIPIVITTTSPQSLAPGIQAAFTNWSDGATVTTNPTYNRNPGAAPVNITVTGTFTTQYQLTTAASPANGGNVTPASGIFYNAGTVVNLLANPAPGFGFSSWTGPVATANATAATVTMDAPKTVTANFGTLTTVNVVVPAGYNFASQGQVYTGPQTFNLASGTPFSVTAATQNLGPGAQAVLANWNDGASITTSPGYLTTIGATPLTITGTFTTQYQLSTTAIPSNGGNVTPANGIFYNAGTVVNLLANPAPGLSFINWSGPVANPNAAATTVTMDAPKSVVANFNTLTTVNVVVPAGYTFASQGQVYTGPQTFSRAPGTVFSITAATQNLGPGAQAVLANWNDGATSTLSPSYITTIGSAPLTITGTFTTQYQLTTAASPSNGGNVTPASGTFYSAGTIVNLLATTAPGFGFSNWTGPVADANTAATTVTMDAPKSVTANFTTP